MSLEFRMQILCFLGAMAGGWVGHRDALRALKVRVAALEEWAAAHGFKLKLSSNGR